MTLPFTDDRFFGIDDSTEPENLPSGFAQDTLNVYVPSGRSGAGGVFKSRAGRRALLTSALGSPFYKAADFRRTDGSFCALIATGGTSNGRIRIWERDANSTTELSSLGDFNAPTVQFARLDDWLFITGNTDGKLRRTNLLPSPGTPTYENCDGLTKPTRTISAELANTTLAAFSDSTDWEPDAADAPLVIVDSDFTNASGVGTVTGPANFGTGWFVGAGDVETAAADPANPGHDYARFDEPGSRIYTRDSALIDNILKTNTHGIGNLDRFAMHFSMSFKYKSDFGSSDSLFISIIGCNAAGNELSRSTKTYSSPSTSGIVNGSLWFSLADLLSDTEPETIRIEIEAGPSNRPGTNGPYISFITVQALVPPATFTSSGDQVSITIDQADADGDFAYIGDNRLVLAVSDQDFSNVSRFAVPVTLLAGLSSFPIRLGLRTGTDATDAEDNAAVYTSDLTFETAQNGITYLAGDLSSIDPAERDHVFFVEFWIPEDIPAPSGVEYRGQTLLTFGPFVQAGNLSVNAAPYRWRYREKRTKSGDFIKSPASEAGGYLEPTTLKAQGLMTVSGSVPQNSEGAGETITLQWFREGGEYRDGLWRLVAEFNQDSDQNSGSNGYWSWDASDRTFLDNSPDISLLNADVMLDHVPTPANILAIGVHAGSRLVVATADGVYVGQITYGLSSGLYWNTVNSETAGDLALQGWFQPLSGNENANAGDVQSIVGIDDRSLVLYRTLPYTLTGTNPLNFDLRPLRIRKELGPVGHRAVQLFDSRAWMLGSDGVRALSLSDAPMVSGDIENRLNPANLWEGNALDAAAYAQASLFAAGDRVFLSVPAGASTTINRTYCYDDRQKRWFPWALGPISGGFSFSGDDDSQEAYFTDSGGMIYRLGPGFGDTSTLNGSVSPVAVQVVGRRLRDPQNEREVWAQYLTAVVECAEAPVVTLTVRADPEKPNPGGREYAITYTGDTGQTAISGLRIGTQVGGGIVQWQIDATTTQPLSLRSVRLDASPGGYL